MTRPNARKHVSFDTYPQLKMDDCNPTTRYGLTISPSDDEQEWSSCLITLNYRKRVELFYENQSLLIHKHLKGLGKYELHLEV